MTSDRAGLARANEPRASLASEPSRPIRVTIIGSLLPEKGVSAYIADLAGALAGVPGVDVDVLGFRSMYPRWAYPGADPVDRHAQSVAIPRVRARRILRWWNPFGWLLAGLTMRGEVVHAQWWSFPLAPIYVTLIALARLRGRRVVVTLHNVEPHEGGMLRRLANRAVLPFAHEIIVHSEANLRALAGTGRLTARVRVIAIGVATTTAPSVDRRVRARAALGVVEGVRLVLFAGNIRPYKGLDVLLDAFPRVLDAVPSARLAIVGQPWADSESDAIESARNAMRDRLWLRLEYVETQEMTRWLDAADVVVYPYTRFDAQSAAACDALARTRAIVVSDVGGLGALVRDERVVVPAGDAGALANAISNVLRDAALQSKLEADATATARDFSWPRVAASTLEAYRGCSSEGVERRTRVTVLGERP